jgi:hypothetical protein
MDIFKPSFKKINTDQHEVNALKNLIVIYFIMHALPIHIRALHP